MEGSSAGGSTVCSTEAGDLWILSPNTSTCNLQSLMSFPTLFPSKHPTKEVGNGSTASGNGETTSLFLPSWWIPLDLLPTGHYAHGWGLILEKLYYSLLETLQLAHIGALQLWLGWPRTDITFKLQLIKIGGEPIVVQEETYQKKLSGSVQRDFVMVISRKVV